MSSFELKNVKEAMAYEYWLIVMQEELSQFIRDEKWDLVPRLRNANVIETKWIFKNKSDEKGNIKKNKARLVAQRYAQVKGIDFDETFAPIARLESIRPMMELACTLNYKLFQMDVKSVFLNGYLNEEVYVTQPKGFEDPIRQDCVLKLEKALCWLIQAPKAWYEIVDIIFGQEGLLKGGADQTLFTTRSNSDFILTQIYVDDIVFGTTSR